jgi:hypothetical protein
MSDSVERRMHQEHLQWHADAESWRADVDIWKRELQDAVRDLDTIMSAVNDSLLALGNHGDAVWEHMQRLQAHEFVVDGELKRGSESTDQDWAGIHEGESARHERLGQAHQRIRQHQHGMIAEVKHLLEKMMEAM